jgi:DnaJ-class molecular chaperone
MRGLGHQSKHYSNKVGTLIINANYTPDNRYIIEGNNLIFPLNLHYQYAIDGLNFEYEHLDDKKYSLKIPPKTKDGDLLRVTGKGLMINQSQRGDLIIKINVMIDYDLLK